MRDRWCDEISVSSFPDREPEAKYCEKPDFFRLWMSLIMVFIGICTLLSIFLIASMPYVIEACIARWEVKVLDFDLGPPPLRVGDPLLDFRNIPPMPGKSADISMLLSVANNPWWLVNDIFMAEIRVGRLGILVYPHSTPINNNGIVRFHDRVPWSSVNEAAYMCLVDASNRNQSIALDVTLGVRFSILGYHSRNYGLKTSVTHRLQRRDGIAPNLGERFERGCSKHLARYTTPPYGTITATEEFEFDPALQLPLKSVTNKWANDKLTKPGG
ncbi:hypothetical protein FOL47_000563 [Perkinsus chesapeaki]|uniref:Uncharacterized protein n=1 Tax=Perkinsus chesapeaki TaxID=330153 RepID=A0A7J6N125_PERCH|nr:hypothetical protein FOL47_000563 [Perkinsus chesapeaki]